MNRGTGFIRPAPAGLASGRGGLSAFLALFSGPRSPLRAAGRGPSARSGRGRAAPPRAWLPAGPDGAAAVWLARAGADRAPSGWLPAGPDGAAAVWLARAGARRGRLARPGWGAPRPFGSVGLFVYM